MEEKSSSAKARLKRGGPVRSKRAINNFQVASGDLKAIDQPQAPLLTKSIGPVGIAQIQHFPLIPDFRTRTAAPHPIFMSTPTKGIFSLDGWDLIQQAREQNHSSIVCEIYHARSDSKTEIALHKAAVRSMPPGGTCTHAEMVANTVLLLGMLMESSENLEVFSHGGARRGIGFIKAREEDAITILAERLGRSRKTILKNLQHGEYLDEQALNAAVEADVPKGFFEAVQQGKTALVSDLKAAKRSEAEIVEVVSAKMLVWLKEAITPVPKEISPIGDPQGLKTSRKESTRQIPKASKFAHWTGNESPKSENPVNEDYIRSEMKRIGTALLQLAEDRNLGMMDRIAVVRGLTVQLSQLTSWLINLSKRDGIAKEGRSNG
jgi:hypothetical protein